MSAWSSKPAARSLIAAAVLCSCGSPYLRGGQRCLEAGALALAMEEYDAGLALDPENPELRTAYVATAQLYEMELRRERELLVSAGHPLLAVTRALELEELDRRASAVGLAPADATARERDRLALEEKAAVELTRDLDRRLGRGRASEADLGACRQLVALRPDPTVARTCDRLLAQFKRMASLVAAPDAHAGAGESLEAIAAAVRAARLDLFEVVPTGDPRVNARLTVFVDAPTTTEMPWTLVGKDAYHEWVPKLDRAGHPIEEEVTVEPSDAEVEEAKRLGKEPPKAKKVKKKVWEEVAGAYSHYQSSRTVTMPYTVSLYDERDGRVLFRFTSSVAATATSAYHEYEGDRRARKDPGPETPQGRSHAPALLDVEALTAEAIAKLPRSIAPSLIERIKS